MSRRKSRQIVLQILYSDEFSSGSKNIDLFLKKEHLNQSDSQFALKVLKGVQEQKESIDKIIKKYSVNWRQDRISLVDLNIIRIAVFEILFYPDVPDKAALNEALELAKNYGEKNSVSFINGILDQVLKNKELDTKPQEL